MQLKPGASRLRGTHLNSFPNDNFLDSSNLKASADNSLNAAKIMISDLNRVENHVGKGENAGSIFSFSQNVFKSSFFRIVKSQDYVVKR